MNDPMNDSPSAIPPPEPPAPPVGGAVTNEERQWALFTHLSGLLVFTGIPFANVLGPLILWQIKKNESAFLDDQGKEALNFQISFSLLMIGLVFVGFVTMFFLIGFVILLAALVAFVAGIVLSVLGAIRANNGEYYRYPWTWRLVT